MRCCKGGTPWASCPPARESPCADQIPALTPEGTALVVSPLISLMKDQVAALIANGVRAAYLNSSLTPGQTERALENARQGLYKMILRGPGAAGYGGISALCPADENFPHRRGRGALRQPMGPGFPPQLSEDRRSLRRPCPRGRRWARSRPRRRFGSGRIFTACFDWKIRRCR